MKVEYSEHTEWMANVLRVNGEEWTVRSGIPDRVTAEELQRAAELAYKRGLQDAVEALRLRLNKTDLVEELETWA